MPDPGQRIPRGGLRRRLLVLAKMRGRSGRPAPKLHRLLIDQHEGAPPRRQDAAFEQLHNGMRLGLPCLRQKFRAEPPVVFGE